MTAWVIEQIEQLKMEQLNRTDFTEEDLAIAKRPRGQRKHYNVDMVMAAELVHFVRELWRDEYGKFHREKDNQPSAEDIVAEYLGFDYERIADYDEETQEKLKLTAELLGYNKKTKARLIQRVSKKKRRGLIAR